MLSSMSESELLLASAAVLLAVMAVMVARIWLWHRRAGLRMEQLASTVATYSDASLRLAATVERVWLAPEQGPPGSLSRRELLRQARDQLAAGESLTRVVDGFGLSQEEARLLSLVDRRQLPDAGHHRS